MSNTQRPTNVKSPKRNKKKHHKRGGSEVGRFFSSLLKTEDDSAVSKVNRQKFHSLKRMKRKNVPPVDAVALTAEERLSRLLHTPKPKISLPEFGNLCDHFVIVGKPDSLSPPQILFQYPSGVPVRIPGLEDFCFPIGVASRELDTSCNSESIALIHGQEYMNKHENTFVFLFTDEQSQVYYCVCIHKEELLSEPPQYVNGTFYPNVIPATTIRCYCLITKFPFFRFHFDFLFSILSIERLTRLKNDAPSIYEHGKKELDVFLAYPQKKPHERRSLRKSDSEAIPKRQVAFPEEKQKKEEISPSSDTLHSIDYSSSNTEVVVGSSSPKESRLVKTDSSEFVVAPITHRRHMSDFGVSSGRNQMTMSHSAINISSGILETSKRDYHPCIQSMDKYFGLPTPTRGNTIAADLGEGFSISFTRPFIDEEEELFAEWGIPLTLVKLSFNTLCQFISAILLEKKILVFAENLRVLSALVLAFPPLIKPFSYQSVIIPMLPAKMDSFLDAPVPFVAGCIQKPDEIPHDVIVLDAVNDCVESSENIPDLPGLAELERKSMPIIKELLLSFGHTQPFHTTVVQRQLLTGICTVFETHFDAIFTNFHNYTICDMSDPTTPISIFMKESFLDDVEHEEIPFLEPFIDTQTFFEYSDHGLRHRDNSHSIQSL